MTAFGSRDLRSLVEMQGVDLLEKPFATRVLLQHVLQHLRARFMPSPPHHGS